MKAHVELLISELKSSHLIINTLKEEIRLSFTIPRNQDNLTNCAEYKSHDELHSTNEKRHAWMEIRRSGAIVVNNKRYKHTDQMVTDTFPLSLNRYDPLCIHFEGDDTPVSTEESGVAKSKHLRKHRMDRRKTVLERKQHKVIILGDIHARERAAKVSHLLNDDFEVLGFVKPGSGMKYIKDMSRINVQYLSKEDVVVLWGDSNDIAKNNSTMSRKHLLEFVININIIDCQPVQGKMDTNLEEGNSAVLVYWIF
jgi:hypothetical protein